jgi:uncharacterized membrane protein YsdA (DUF1294 family)
MWQIALVWESRWPSPGLVPSLPQSRWAVWRGHIALALLIEYAVMSGLAFVVYAMDKSRAQRGDRRIPEAVLHLLAIFCGWPGALLAQQWLRHKIRKLLFQGDLLDHRSGARCILDPARARSEVIRRLRGLSLSKLEVPPSIIGVQRAFHDVMKLCIIVGTTIGGWVGWALARISD